MLLSCFLGIWNKIFHKYTGENNEITANCYILRNTYSDCSHWCYLLQHLSGFLHYPPVYFEEYKHCPCLLSLHCFCFLQSRLGKNHPSAAAKKAASVRHRQCWQLHTGQECDSVPIKQRVLMLMLTGTGSRSRSSNFSCWKPSKTSQMSELRLEE